MTAADRDRAGGDDNHLLAPGAATGDIVGQYLEPLVPDFAAVGHQQRRADLDDQPPRRSQRLGGTGGAGISPPKRPGSRRHHVACARDPASALSECSAASAANSCASTAGTPAPETPDNGMTTAPRPAARRSFRIFPSIISG